MPQEKMGKQEFRGFLDVSRDQIIRNSAQSTRIIFPRAPPIYCSSKDHVFGFPFLAVFLSDVVPLCWRMLFESGGGRWKRESEFSRDKEMTHGALKHNDFDNVKESSPRHRVHIAAM